MQIIIFFRCITRLIIGCKSRKLRLVQNKTKCIVLKVKPWLYKQTMINVNCSCKIFLHKGRQVWKPTSLRARTEIDASTAWRNLWHEKPNLPPCIAHPTQDPLSARMVLLELNNSDCEDALLHVLRLVCRLVDHQVST